MKNRAYHQGIKRSPYEAMFGMPAKVGLKSSILPDDVEINTEEELEELLNIASQRENIVEENQENIQEELNEENENSLIEDSENIITLDTNKDNIMKKRKNSKESLQKQAKKIISMSEKQFPQGKVGDCVKIRVPDVDRAR